MTTRLQKFQSTRPLRGATVTQDGDTAVKMISIHAPLAGRDPVFCLCTLLRFYFNPRAPCGARRPCYRHTGCADYFNPRAPCGARRPRAVCQSGAGSFQSTRPLRGATSCAPILALDLRFQSTRPLRGATSTFALNNSITTISIHAPLAGRDSKSAQKNAALLRKRYKYKLFVCKKCTSGDLTGAYSSKNTLYSGANCSENPCALSVRTHRISGPSTSNPGLMPKCSILERYFSPR